MKSPSLQVFKDWDQLCLRTTLTNTALLWVGLGLVQEPLPQQAGDRSLQGYTGAKGLQWAIQMRRNILIMSFFLRKRSPLFQRSCIHTHQGMIKLKSTDVVGWDVSCSQRLRNLSDNSTFICGEIKHQTLEGLAKASELTSSMPTYGEFCLHKLQSEGISVIKCILSHQVRIKFLGHNNILDI